PTRPAGWREVRPSANCRHKTGSRHAMPFASGGTNNYLRTSFRSVKHRLHGVYIHYCSICQEERWEPFALTHTPWTPCSFAARRKSGMIVGEPEADASPLLDGSGH